MAVGAFQYHTFLHHSQTFELTNELTKRFQYHTFLHHSQTEHVVDCIRTGFSTIRFYIILKLSLFLVVPYASFSTIRFYIILKPICQREQIFTSFSTIRFYIILKRPPNLRQNSLVSVPYVFTSFSNPAAMFLTVFRFQYHTFLHHSQTSNSKMNRHHLRKTRYSNTFNRFHIDLYL